MGDLGSIHPSAEAMVVRCLGEKMVWGLIWQGIRISIHYISAVLRCRSGVFCVMRSGAEKFKRARNANTFGTLTVPLLGDTSDQKERLVGEVR